MGVCVCVCVCGVMCGCVYTYIYVCGSKSIGEGPNTPSQWVERVT
eukprot:NODE_7222_length_412_cov_79.779614_g4969_i1.p4 GENE.NODE_7222_length_412_cov_79.779614_g4969_i1~~NODE_7222_length_412_cov_79.779614_g4969_i1.p4  ORF type:complete len:54 (+),score=25.74 NODE_7222_length_412_cov_79.779614_g4969_i1:30-164(+)